MANIWLVTLGSVVLVSLISLIGVLTLRWSQTELKPFLLTIVSFSTGALLGDVFVHLLPELVEETEGMSVALSLTILGGILLFFILEKFIHWHHCHIPEEHRQCHPFAYTNLIGDGLHNFIDGMVIATSYFISLPIGFATTIAVILHEIPQEISDFGVLLHGGFTRAKALFFNYITAATAIAGALLVLLLGGQTAFSGMQQYLVAFTAGGFIYIAATDLLPELHKETNPLSSIVQVVGFVSGIAVMLSLLLIE